MGLRLSAGGRVQALSGLSQFETYQELPEGFAAVLAESYPTVQVIWITAVEPLMTRTAGEGRM